jgi:hypothetical protein
VHERILSISVTLEPASDEVPIVLESGESGGVSPTCPGVLPLLVLDGLVDSFAFARAIAKPSINPSDVIDKVFLIDFEERIRKFSFLWAPVVQPMCLSRRLG